MPEKKYIILHHSAYVSSDPQFACINRWHKDRRFPRSSLGFYVGYQYVIEANGEVWQARTEEEPGAHTVSTKPEYKNLNETEIGVCLAGDFTKENPTEAQLVSITALVKAIQERHAISNENVLLHREVKNTSCPGTDLRAIIFQKDEWERRLKVAESAEASGRIFPPRLFTLRRMIMRLRCLLGY